MRLFDQRFYVVQKGVVILTRSRVFERFPGDDQPQEVQPPMRQAAEVLISFLQREGPPHEGDIAPFSQAVGQVGVAGRLCRDFAGAAEVDAVQDQRASVFVFEPAAVGGDGHGSVSSVGG